MQSNPVPVNVSLDYPVQTGNAASLRQDRAFVDERARVIRRLRRMAWLAALGLASWGLIIGTLLLLV